MNTRHCTGTDSSSTITKSAFSQLALLAACALLASAFASSSLAIAADQRTDDDEHPPRDISIPLIDLAQQTHRRSIIDREPGQYLGHPTTVLLEDGMTVLTVYPKGHGRGPIVLKRSNDGGITWSDRLPTPDNWETGQETPTIHRTVDRDGNKRLILFSGLYPIRMSVSEDDGRTWSPLEPIGDFGGIVAMSSVEPLRDAPGHYMALFHDDGRFIDDSGTADGVMRLYKILTEDGGLTWSEPELLHEAADVHLCEPGAIRSPDGRTIAVLLRENRRQRNSYIIFSDDEGETWTEPRELPGSLTGDRHVARYAPGRRLIITFRDMAHESETRGDWVAWVGTWDDLLHNREGQYRIRLGNNQHDWDCGYPGLEVLPDGSLLAVSYGHWERGEQPFVIAKRFALPELDRALYLQRENIAADDTLNIFYCTQSLGFRHDVLPLSRRILAQLDHAHDDLAITISDDLADLPDNWTDTLDVLMLYTTGPLAIDTAKLHAWIEAGGALVGIHSATDTLKSDETYVKLIGGVFDGHPWNERVRILIDKPNHPTMRPFVDSYDDDDSTIASFMIADEIYQFHTLNDDMTVLMRLDPSTPRAEAGRPYPLAWMRTVGEGRVFYNALGHRHEVFLDERFQQHILAAIRWAAGQ